MSQTNAALGYTQYVGTEAAPIVMTATAGVGDVWTWDHNNGAKAVRVEVLNASSRQPIGPSDQAAPTAAAIVVTQPTVNQMVVTNQSTLAVNVIVRVTWQDLSTEVFAPLAASVGTLS